MAEVLSQNQIDALLSALRSGEKDLSGEPEVNPEKKYPKYDFYSPKKFTRDRIKIIGGIFETYARMITSRLNTLLHTNCEISVESIEEQRYHEFSNALTEGDVLSLANADFDGQESSAPVIIYLSKILSLSMMDVMMGGNGHIDENLMQEYTYTELELQLYENTVRDLVGVMGGSWENYINIEFEYDRTEVNPTLVQLVSFDEIVMIVDLKLSFPNCSGRMSICLPAVMLTDIFTSIGKKNVGKQIAVEDKSKEIFDQLRDSDLEIVVELGKMQLHLSDLYHMNVGDVIDMGESKDAPVSVSIGGYQWFSGYLGSHKKNVAVKIDKLCYDTEERSE